MQNAICARSIHEMLFPRSLSLNPERMQLRNLINV